MQPSINLFFTFLAVGMVTLVSAEASLIAEWNFDDEDLVADGGSQAGTAGLTTTDPLVFPESYADRGGGDKALQIGGVTVAARGFTLAFSGTGLSGFAVSYEAEADQLGITDTAYSQMWTWSTDNLSYSGVGITQPGQVTSTVSFDNYTVDFSGVSDLNGATTIYLRNEVSPIFDGVTDIRFDNISVQAVPEPSGTFALVLGSIVVGFWVKRRNSRISVSLP